MLTTFILFTILRMASTKSNMILSSFTPPEGWTDEMRFWGSTTCHAGRRRTFSLYEAPRSSSTRHLHDFFGALVTNVQTECGSTMRTKFYRIDDDANDTEHLNAFYGEGSPTNHPEIFQESENITTTAARRQIHLFPFKDVEIVTLMLKNSVRTLMNANIFNNFNIKRHVLVLMISEANDPHESAESLKNTFVVLLQRLWRERRVLNVFFAAPFSSLGCRIWFYDPFIKNVTSGARGKIFALGVGSISTVDRVKDLAGYTLNIGMFDIAPTSIKLDPTLSHNFPYSHKAKGFGGIDGITMATAAERMNFTLNIVPPSDGVEFGYVRSNGTAVGTIGDAAYHRIDIGFNSMYTKMYTSTKKQRNSIEFTAPIDFDRLCVVVPRARKIPRWLRTFYYFDPSIWVCVVLTQILVSLVWYFLRKFRGSSRDNLARTTGYHALLLDTFLLFVGAPLKLNTSQAERMLLSALFLLGLTMIGIITGTLYHSFTKEMYYKEINTLKELDASGIPIGTASPNLHDVFGMDEEDEDDADEVKSLRQKFSIMPYDNGPTVEKTARLRNVASLSRQHSFRYLMYRYVDDAGTSLLHLVEECPRSYYLSYVVPKDSVYIDRLNVLIIRLREAGLPPLWNSDTTNQLVIVEFVKSNLKRVKATNASFDINDMQTPFFILFIGYLVAIFVFIGEISYNRIQRALKIGHGNRSKSDRKKSLVIVFTH